VLPNINYCTDPYQAAQDADAILIVTEWDEFRSLDWARLRQLVERPLILDGRNVLDAKEVASHGFDYIGVGQPPVMAVRNGAAVEGAASVTHLEREALADTITALPK
jgi:UDPglucose 6-dehydrogenase